MNTVTPAISVWRQRHGVSYRLRLKTGFLTAACLSLLFLPPRASYAQQQAPALSPAVSGNAAIVASSATEHAASSSSHSTALLTARIDAALGVPALRNASVGILVQSLQDGRIVYERNADLALLPASNQKVLTAVTALSRLGPEYRFATTILRTGTVDSRGVLRGDLVLRGTGDPSLTSERLGAMARAVREAGIKRVEGRIVADASYFDDRLLGAGWAWDNEPYAYQPQVSALNCDENVLIVSVSPGERRAGEAVEVTLRPRTAYVTVRSEARVATDGEQRATLDFDRARARNEFVVTGTLPSGAKPVEEALTIEDPALYAGTRLRELLREAGVTVSPAAIVRGVAPASASVVTESRSESLRVLLVNFLKTSNNLYGEVFLKAVGAQGQGSSIGSSRAGGRVVAEVLTNDAKMDTGGLNVADGSGLSRLNTVTARTLVGALSFVQQDAPAPVRDAFTAALPIAGVDGTLRSRLKRTAAEGKVRAKTGTLNGVSALSGYLTTKAGEPLAFSILMNNYERANGSAAARAVQDALVTLLIETPLPRVKLMPEPQAGG